MGWKGYKSHPETHSRTVMIYLTFGDKYSGIYQSQVIDVLEYIYINYEIKVKLISFVPYPVYREQKEIIKLHYSNVTVLPMIPSRNHWVIFYSTILLITSFFTLLNQKCVARGIWSTNILLMLRQIGIVKWICYDGRGASLAEWEEYLSHNIQVDLKKIYKAERNAVFKANYRISVSAALVSYWKEKYSYKPISDSHVIIPCAVGISYEKFISDKERIIKRTKLGFNSNETVIVFSGGIDKWQSPDLLGRVMNNIVKNNDNIKFLFLTRSEILHHPAIKTFESMISTFWVKPDEVSEYLVVGDFGLLIREQSVTNKVAAPTKFAEYLACGLEVIITDKLGDYSAFVERHSCGTIYSNQSLFLQREKARIELFNLSQKYFQKSSFAESYKKIYSHNSKSKLNRISNEKDSIYN